VVLRVITLKMPPGPEWVLVLSSMGEWRGVVLSPLSRTTSPGRGLGMSFASVVALEVHVDSRMTTVVKSVVVIVGKFANRKVCYI
jgi:hypothetical protein